MIRIRHNHGISVVNVTGPFNLGHDLVVGYR